jgi:hypothetical protein
MLSYRRVRTAITFCALAAIVSPLAAEDHQIAPGWIATGSASYDAAIDGKVRHGGASSLVLRLREGQATGSFAVRQRVKADAYRGKRVELSGWLKADRAEGGAALWLRVDMANGDYILDNMLDLTAADAAAKRGWTRISLVADVPGDAAGISFGVRMKGTGEVWADDLAVKVVSNAVATTTVERRPFRGPGRDAAVRQMLDEYGRAPSAPVNGGFEAR